MKHHSKIIAFGLAAAMLMSLFTGCTHRKKTVYQTYMQNVLDVNYKGDFDGYIKDNEGSESDAEAMYNESISYLAGQLISHYSLGNADSDEVQTIFNDTAKTIYSNAKYEVSQAYRSGDDYVVDVTVYPMDILNQAFDDVFAYIESSNSKISSGDYEDTTKEDYEAVMAQGIADILQTKSENMEYLSPVVVTVKIIDDGEYYSVDTSDLASVDASMLAIEGSPTDESSTDESSTEDTSADADSAS